MKGEKEMTSITNHKRSEFAAASSNSSCLHSHYNIYQIQYSD